MLDIQYHGASSRWQVKLDEGTMFSASLNEIAETEHIGIGRRVRLAWQRKHAISLQPEPEQT